MILRDTKKEKKTLITVGYDTDKLAALEMYLGEKSDLLDKALYDTVDRMYNRFVPPTVKTYIAFQQGAKSDFKKDGSGATNND